MSNLPPPTPGQAPVHHERRESPLSRIFWIVFVVVWALTALFVLTNGGAAIDVIACAINGAVWGGIVVLIVWLVRKGQRR